MHFVVLTMILAIGTGYVAPKVLAFVQSSVPSLSLSSSPLLNVIAIGAVLAGTLYVAKHFLGRKAEV